MSAEANQGFLDGLGVILIPGLQPPDRIDDVHVYAGQYNVLKKPNKRGKVYYYKRDHRMKCWYMDNERS